MGIQFFIPGIPAPGGSKRAIHNKYTGRIAVIDACKRNGAWKDTVAYNARQAYQGAPLDGPLVLTVQFRMPRPKGHFGAKGLRGSAPIFPAVKPDTTKLLRALEDALTGIAWGDDAQIVDQHVTKRYCKDEAAGAMVWVETADVAAPV